MPDPRPVPTVRAYTPTALPPVGARLAAFVAILVGGICGGLLTYAIVDLQCSGDDGRAREVLAGVVPATPASTPLPGAPEARGCDLVAGGAGLLGAVVSAAGVSVVSVLALRAMAEWRKDLVLHEQPGPPPSPPSPPPPRQRTSRIRR